MVLAAAIHAARRPAGFERQPTDQVVCCRHLTGNPTAQESRLIHHFPGHDQKRWSTIATPQDCPTNFVDQYDGALSVVDVFSSEDRSALMGRIRSHGNKTTELRLIEIFKANGITGWRRKQDLVGKPDFVFRQSRLCVFVDGCFWHGCPKCHRSPGSNQDYWLAKIARNRARDRLVSRTLKASGWEVLRIWEHQLADKVRWRLLSRLSKRGIVVKQRGERGGIATGRSYIKK